MTHEMPYGGNAVFVRLILFKWSFLLSHPFSDFINVIFKILNQIAKWFIPLGQPPGFKRNLGRFVGLENLLL